MNDEPLSLEKLGNEVAKYLREEKIKEKKEMSDLITATLRTAVPAMTVYFTTFLTARGVELDTATITALETALFGLLVAIWYALVRLVARKYPQLESLLGAAKKPVYVEPTKEA